MGIVADFVESDDLGWNVSRSEFLTKILEELPQFPEIAVLITGDTTMIYKRKHIKVKVVTPNGTGNPE